MIVIGAQYYRPPGPPEKDWRRDLQQMRDSGMNTVKYWACWSWMEQHPGAYDFADLDRLMDLAHEIGLGVVINTIIENAPYWLEARFPHARYQDAEGRPVHLSAAMNTPGGGWPGLCFDNSEVWDAARLFLEAVIDRYDAHPALVAWDVWNEPHLEPASYFPDRLYCYCDASLRRFAAFLRDRHGDIDGLNAAWQRRYSHWSQVAPPRIFEAVPDMIDWREHWFENLRSWLDQRVATVRARVRPSRTVMTHVALSGFTGQLATHTIDEFTLTESVDAFGTSSFPTWLMRDDPVEHFFNLETARDASEGKPFWQAELQGGRGRRDGLVSTGQPAAAHTALWMWNALAAGSSGIMFWQWRPEALGPESPGYGLTTPDGTPTDRVAAASALARIAAIPEVEDRLPVPGTVGLLLSRKAALHAFATDRTMGLYTSAALGGYRLLLAADLQVQILHEDRVARDGVPDGIDAVYWPMPAVSDDLLDDRLSAFVRGGGRLVAESSPGEYSATGRRRPSVPGEVLAEVFGAREFESTSTSVDDLAIGDHTLPFGWQRAALVVNDDATVIARFADGEAAVVRHGYGSGLATLVATFPSVVAREAVTASAGAAIRQLLGIEAMSGWVGRGPGLLSRTARTADHRLLHFVMNWSGHDALWTAERDARVIQVGAAGMLSEATVRAGSAVEIGALTGRLFIGL